VPTQPYFNKAGERRAGTTYVIGQNLGWNKDALMGWANREGLAGRSIKESRTSTAGRAADIGTTAHKMIEGRILGYEPKLFAADELTLLTCDEDRAKAKRGFANFDRWYSQSNLRIVGTEVFGVDEEYQTGFCSDALALEAEHTIEEPAISLLDWKSSKGTYSDHFIQVSAYTVFNEALLTAFLERPIRLVGAHVVRVSKDTGTFKHVFWDRESLDLGFKAFSWCRALHEIHWEVEKYVR
jgi:hypothetical protein